ncbi:MAG: ribosome-associated translation inhibitor RaiA [Candidatus Omnitrophica bacterium]|nr:ribosome-associated translation inhibitor RaiA [Candidatus Omnitrophota bacterium]
MEIDISGRHFHVTAPLKAYVTEKLGKLEKYALKLETARVIFEVQRFHHLAEIVVRGKNLRLTAREENADTYAAFDECFGNIQLQLRRQHDRIKDHKARRFEGARADKRRKERS